MKKKVSNSDRARIWNVDVYADMVKECPKDLLSEKGSFSYFGTSLPLLLAEKRRKQSRAHSIPAPTRAKL